MLLYIEEEIITMSKIINFPIQNDKTVQTTLPSSLSPNEEQELIKRLSENDNIEAKQKLIEGNYKLMLSILSRYKTENIDDLICVAVIGLIKAVNTFDNIKEIKLTDYITKCIENEINMYLQQKH